MTKPKSPLISLGAKGSIGNALTYQQRNQDTIVRKKPIPAYRRTLPQLYQRWLYEDYAYWWTQQTEATKRQYAATGSRFHLTGFQYWMKYNLTNLPDIAGWWTLDSHLGATTPDKSRNNNTGTIIGAVPISGVIDGALSFDGINDFVNCGNDTSLNITNAITLEAWVKRGAFTGSRYVMAKGADRYVLYFQSLAPQLPVGYVAWPTEGKVLSFIDNIALDTWTHLAWTYNRTVSEWKAYINGVLKNTLTRTEALPTDSLLFSIGSYYTGINNNFPGDIDEVSVRTRALDENDILRHANRRYPA